ncbi:signal recognition particle-docking protein FtsY [Candidatus Woesearchaeota archaeon]|jgi:fused signal recognition particle receptor|nr:signal recognition particle-docking protein FtsY [Candidatus Woesearchaeota archaeon]
MFGKLKDKLKGALSVFSKKAEEEAVETKVDEVVEGPEEKVTEEVSEESKEEVKPEEEKAEVVEEEDDISEEELERADKLIEETNQEIFEEPQEEFKEEEKEEEVPTKFVVGQNRFEPDLEEIKETKESKEEVSKEEKEEPVEEKEEVLPKEEDISEEELERADKLIEETNKEETNKEETPTEESVEEDKESEEDDDDDEKFVPIPEVSNDREIPSAESLIEATKDKFAVEELPQEEQDKIKEAERQPTAAELLEEVADEAVEDEKEEVIEPVKEKKLFGLFKRKEKVIEEKEEIIKEEEKVIEEKKEVVEEPQVEEVKPVEEKEVIAEKSGFFGKVKQSLTTKTISADKFETLFWELEIALLESNVSVEVIEKIKEDLKEELVDKPLPRDVPKKIEETLSKTLNEILTFDKIDILEKAKNKKPLIIAFFGINGSGKTTSIAKLANYFKENNLSVVLAACDTFRAAAIQQLEEHANKLEVKMIKHDYGSDAAAVAFDAVKYAEKHKVDVVLIDTAGRLHSNTNLMAELEKIIRITNPDLKIFIGESITGNDCIEQARKFNELVEMDGAILTKADVDEKGGAPLSIAYTIKKPILFLGMGQEYKDFEAFDKNVILERLGF